MQKKNGCWGNPMMDLHLIQEEVVIIIPSCFVLQKLARI